MMIPPCQVSVGTQSDVARDTITYLQKQFCNQAQNGEPCFCSICSQISSQQFHRLTWITPASGEYVLKDLEPIFNTVRFALEQGTHHFLVIQDAQTLSIACANRLLKVLEEPPAGYHFLLLTTNFDALLPTIQSRCTRLHTLASQLEQDPVIKMLLAVPQNANPGEFEKILRSQQPSVSYARDIAHKLIHLVDVESFKNQDLAKETLLVAQKHLPMSGGSQLFLKMIYLGFMQACQ